MDSLPVPLNGLQLISSDSLSIANRIDEDASSSSGESISLRAALTSLCLATNTSSPSASTLSLWSLDSTPADDTHNRARIASSQLLDWVEVQRIEKQVLDSLQVKSLEDAVLLLQQSLTHSTQIELGPTFKSPKFECRDLVVYIVALRLLASSFTPPPATLTTLPAAFYDHKKSSPPLITALIFLSLASLGSRAAGHHARNSSVVPAWPALYEGPQLEDSVTEKASRTRLFSKLLNANRRESAGEFIRWTIDADLGPADVYDGPPRRPTDLERLTYDPIKNDRQPRRPKKNSRNGIIGPFFKLKWKKPHNHQTELEAAVTATSARQNVNQRTLSAAEKSLRAHLSSSLQLTDSPPPPGRHWRLPHRRNRANDISWPRRKAHQLQLVGSRLRSYRQSRAPDSSLDTDGERLLARQQAEGVWCAGERGKSELDISV